MNRMKKNRVLAFTLIELIISSLIIACVSAAVYAVFSGGIGAWKRSHDTKSYERSLRLVSEVTARELRNALKFSGIPFEGGKNSVSFAGIIEDISLQEEEPVYQLGKISYFLNAENVLCRKQQTYAEVFQEQEPAAVIKELIPAVAGLSFSYLSFDSETGISAWQDTWQNVLDEEDAAKQEEDEEDTAKQDEGPEAQETGTDGQAAGDDFGIPKAVRIELELQDGAGQFTKTIIIPVGNGVEKKGRE